MRCPHCNKDIFIKGDPSRVEKAISYYYRQRGHGGKRTLKQIATEVGIPYSSITKVKMKYDRAHGKKRP